MNEDIILKDQGQSIRIVRDIEKEMKSAFLDYSMSVIVQRALPDVRDGLKPVHRRILFTMYERGNDPAHPYRKSADTVGAVLGSYHPHGDASVYDALVRLAQDFSMRYPLVDGQGNFGSVDGDPPAAYRYTEARMSKLSVDLLADIDKDTVDFVPNFDETKTQPSVLPSRVPNLLINGSTGIAVGMATNIPPHNVSEVIDGAIYLIDEGEQATLPGLMDHIKGPDFPTGGIIMGRSGIRAAYATGRGKITLRGVANIEETKTGRSQIVITELPYMVNKARLVESIADLVKEKRVEGISDLRDETNRLGMKVIIELKKEANAQVVLNRLYQYTQLQTSIGVIMLALDDGVPRIMDIMTMLRLYIAHRAQVVTRRTRYDLQKAQERAHVLEGLARAIDIVDEIIATIRATKGGQPEAKRAIMEKFDFDDPQASAIVAFRLGQLAGLEILKIRSELADLEKKIAEWLSTLSSEAAILAVVKTELLEMKEKYGDGRRTDIAAVSGEVDIEDLIPVEQCVLTRTHAGYLKRQPADTYAVQHRGGRGITALSRKEEDFVEEVYTASSHDYMLFVTNLGRVYRMKTYEIPEGSRTAKGTHILNILPLAEGEKISSMLHRKGGEGGIKEGFLVMITRRGIIKRTPLVAYKNIRKSGLITIGLDEGDELVWARITDGTEELLVATAGGMAIRFAEGDIRPTGRTARGVRAIRLKEGDEVVGMAIVREGANLFTATEAGKGRRTPFSEYRLQSRGGKGIRNYGTRSRVAEAISLADGEDVIAISENGIIIRLRAEDISEQSRYGGGVRIMRLGEEDKLVTVARTDREEGAETVKPLADPEDEEPEEPYDEEEELEEDLPPDDEPEEELDEELEEDSAETLEENAEEADNVSEGDLEE